MNMSEQGVVGNPLLQLLGLSRRARAARTAEELAFLAVNDTRALVVYRQAALWIAGSGVKALSGVVAPEANAPYTQWLECVLRELQATQAEAAQLTSALLPDALSAQWNN